MSERTIAAVSTPPGEGGISVIRISGENAIACAEKVFFPFGEKKLSELKGYSGVYGEAVFENEVIDDGVALVFRAPKSYTGEDVVELSLHGGNAASRRVLRALYANDVVPAAAGEFTKRAFLNGKLDLTKAESVMGIISAKSETALRISRAAKQGRISREIEEITGKLLETAASLSVYADYPDEEIENLKHENFLDMLTVCEERLARLLKTYDAGRVLREGIGCCIAGKPNVGKSTLMNMLSRADRSIVTDIAGTTRDIVENTVQVGDILLNLADTAGIRSTGDPVEQAGVSRALERLENASLVLAVFDLSRPLDGDDKNLLERLNRENTLLVLNKCDLEKQADLKAFEGFDTVEISAKNGAGEELLEQKIARMCGVAALSPDDAVLISERQRSCAAKALASAREAREALASGITPDAVGVCVDDCLASLLELTGKRVTNEVCDEVFRRFCVGK